MGASGDEASSRGRDNLNLAFCDHKSNHSAVMFVAKPDNNYHLSVELRIRVRTLFMGKKKMIRDYLTSEELGELNSSLPWDQNTFEADAPDMLEPDVEG